MEGPRWGPRVESLLQLLVAQPAFGGACAVLMARGNLHQGIHQSPRAIPQEHQLEKDKETTEEEEEAAKAEPAHAQPVLEQRRQQENQGTTITKKRHNFVVGQSLHTH